MDVPSIQETGSVVGILYVLQYLMFTGHPLKEDSLTPILSVGTLKLQEVVGC